MAEGWDWWLGDNSIGGGLLKLATGSSLDQWRENPLESAALGAAGYVTTTFPAAGRVGQNLLRSQQMREQGFQPGTPEYQQRLQREEEQKAIAEQQQAAALARQQQASLLSQQAGNLQAMQNPYDPRSPAFQRGLQSQRAAALLNFAPQRQRLSEQLAGRGLLGSGLEAGSQTALAGQQAGALANLEAGAYRDVAGQQGQFELQRQQQLGQLAGQVGQLGLERQQHADYYMALARQAAAQGRADEARKWELMARMAGQIGAMPGQAAGQVAQLAPLVAAL